MRSTHVLRIDCEAVHLDSIDIILNMPRSNHDLLYWEYVIVNDNSDMPLPLFT